MAYRVEIAYNRGLQSIRVNGDEMGDISAIEGKQIEEWFKESGGRSGWRGLIPEIKDFIGDDRAELSFEFQGAKEDKEVFEKCLKEHGFVGGADGMSKDDIVQMHMEDARKAKNRGFIRDILPSWSIIRWWRLRHVCLTRARKTAPAFSSLKNCRASVGKIFFKSFPQSTMQA